ncbi:MAG: ComF family protein [Chloroflexales bacterium]|nr:ComF family protein [Chloroflexales bacterium]
MSIALRSFADNLLSLLFPERCVSCHRFGQLFCQDCQARLRPYPAERRAFTALDDVGVVFIFEDVLRDAIYSFKYRRVRRMAKPLGQFMAVYLQAYPLPADALIPVPLHPQRRAERGFNQSEELARWLHEASNLPLNTTSLARIRNTEHQARLDTQARQENVKGSFVWQPSSPPPDRVLLVDDVLTTGATLEACAGALRLAGAREVRAIALARSLPSILRIT